MSLATVVCRELQQDGPVVQDLLSWRKPVRVASTANFAATRTGNVLQANSNGSINNTGIDGVTTLGVNDRVLLKNQSTGADRGPYRILDLGSGGTPCRMERVPDFDASPEAAPGSVWVVGDGVVNGGAMFRLATPPPITLNTTSLTFVPIDHGAPPVFLSLCGSTVVDLASWRIAGGTGGSLDPALFVRAGRSAAWALVVQGVVSAPGIVAEVALIDDLGATVATVELTDSSGNAVVIDSFSIPNAARYYSLQARLSTAPGPGDYGVIIAASIRIIWS